MKLLPEATKTNISKRKNNSSQHGQLPVEVDIELLKEFFLAPHKKAYLKKTSSLTFLQEKASMFYFLQICTTAFISYVFFCPFKKTSEVRFLRFGAMRVKVFLLPGLFNRN